MAGDDAGTAGLAMTRPHEADEMAAASAPAAASRWTARRSSAHGRYIRTKRGRAVRFIPGTPCAHWRQMTRGELMPGDTPPLRGRITRIWATNPGSLSRLSAPDRRRGRRLRVGGPLGRSADKSEARSILNCYLIAGKRQQSGEDAEQPEQDDEAKRDTQQPE